MDERVTSASRIVAERFETPAELDVFVNLYRSAGSDAHRLAGATGLRPSHALEVAERLVTTGAIVRSDLGYAVAEGVREEAALVSSVFDHYRHRLVDAVVARED